MQSFTCENFFPWAEWWCPHHWESPAEAALACQPHITSVWFSRAVASEPVWPSLFEAGQHRLCLSSGSGGLLPRLEGQPLQMLTWLWGKKWGVMSSILMTSTGDLILGPGYCFILRQRLHYSYWFFHHEGYLWNQKGQKSIVCFAETVSDRGKGWGPGFEDKNLSTHLELKHFVFSLCSANWRDLSQTISFLRLKDSPKSCWNVYSQSVFRQVEMMSFVWLEACSLPSKREAFKEITYCFSIKGSCLDVHTLPHVLSQSYVSVLFWGKSISQNLCTLVKIVKFS